MNDLKIGGATVLLGDCIERLRGVADKTVQTCVTSPPYFGLRDYGHDGQLGLEPTPEAYVAGMVAVFREVRRVLSDDGTLWLNIGDSYARNPSKGGSGPGGKNGDYSDSYTSANQRRSDGDGVGQRAPQLKQRAGADGIKEKDLIGIPWMLAFALRADGWYLRQDIIWHKPNPMPESVRDRCTKAHEYMFLLSKSERYFFDSEAMREPAVKGASGSDFHTGKTAAHQLGRASTKPRKQNSTNDSFVPGATAHGGLHREGSEREPETRNRRSVWTVATRPYKGAHFATFPPALIEPCILAGSRPGDIVLDPFNGSGTTGQVALQHGRQYLGCELNPEYVELTRTRLEPVVDAMAAAAEPSPQPDLFSANQSESSAPETRANA
jgi:DNA modification methylase